MTELSHADDLDVQKLIHIDDLDVPGLDVYSKLNENQLRHYCEPSKEGLFIAETAEVVKRALDAGYEPVSMLLDEKYVKPVLPDRTCAADDCESRLSPANSPIRDLIERYNHIELETGKQVPVYAARSEVLFQITGINLTRGVLSAFRRKKLPPVDEICRNAKRIVILEDIENPTNIGAIFRSAAALSMDAVLLTPGCADPLQRRSIRVSVGTVFQIPWTRISEDNGAALSPHSSAGRAAVAPGAWAYCAKPVKTSKDLRYGESFPGAVFPYKESVREQAPAAQQDAGQDMPPAVQQDTGEYMSPAVQQCKRTVRNYETSKEKRTAGGGALWPDDGIRKLHEAGFRVVSMALRNNTVSIDDPRFESMDKLAILMGNEGSGLMDRTIRLSDYTVKIPMRPGVDSLNVAAASAVAFWALGRR